MMVLTERDLDEIVDKVRDTAIEVLQQFEQKYMKTLGGVQKDLRELQLQATNIQEYVGKAIGTQGSSAWGKSTVA